MTSSDGTPGGLGDPGLPVERRVPLDPEFPGGSEVPGASEIPAGSDVPARPEIPVASQIPAGSDVPTRPEIPIAPDAADPALTAAPGDDQMLDGHSMDELSEYLHRGRLPVDESIESSPGCRMALAGMERLRAVSVSLLEQDAADQRGQDEQWLRGILDGISREAHAGRDIPVVSTQPAARLRITEGAVRGMLRSAGDAVPGIVIGRCRLDGDVTVPGAPVRIEVDASVLWGTPIPEAADRVRTSMRAALDRHTDLVITAIDVTVHDVHGHPSDGRLTA